MPVISGIVLAAGAGTRHGGPKALVEGWLADATQLLLDGGCERVVVVLGAGADEARETITADERVMTVEATDWADGMGASLRAGLAHATGDAVLITLVDLPGTPVTVVDRLLGDTQAGPTNRQTLRQATYDGRPGHPVLVGADHVTALSQTLRGDRGARPYLLTHGVIEVECGDLHHGRDEDS